ncbi:MAG: hypothetical protein L0Y58_04760 [Verrucomicrobia subdivision 3 bacterium]|nr:hypothetical protein [Limisphaerales bacterium]
MSRPNPKKKRFNLNREQKRERPGSVFKTTVLRDIQIAADTLDLAEARRAGITLLPFAGEPQWSESVSAALAKATAIARAGRTKAGTLHLLAGLLDVGGGIATEILGKYGARSKDLAEQLEKGPPGTPNRQRTEQGTTPHYDQALSYARSLAKRAGSPVVLEVHLLGALLKTQSQNLDKFLGTNRQELMDALQEAQQFRPTVFESAAFSFMPQIP